MSTVVADLVRELPKSKLPAGSAVDGGEFVFFVSGPKPLLCDVAIKDGEAIVLSTGGNAAVHIGRKQFSYSTDCWALEPIASKVSGEFLYQYIRFKIDHIDTFGFEGSGLRHLKKEFLRKYPVPEFAKPEQAKIAEILSTVDRAIEQTEALIAKHQRIKAGVLHDLLTRGIDEHGNLRSEQTHEFKDSPLGRIPVEWEVNKIGEVFEIQLGKMLSQKATEGVSPFQYLGNKNVQWDRVDTSELQFMDFNEYERHKFGLKPGDILVCEGGEVGRTAIWRGEVENCYFQKAIHRLRSINQQYLHDLFPRFMRWGKTKGILSNYTSQTSIAHLTQEKLAIVPIMIPSRSEQIQLNATFDQLDNYLGKQSAKLTKLRSLKTALMQDILTGKKRVTALLENIP